jgi:hypothetical protein
LQLRLSEKVKKGVLKAADVVDLVASPDVQQMFSQRGICKPSISERTAIRWLTQLNWRYGRVRAGMYIDGHERDDVVMYRDEFVKRWMGATGYEKRMHQWDNDGNELRPTGFPVKGGRFRIIPVTHDESTFYQNDERKTVWAQKSERPLPKPKGEGQSIMVSDFLTAEWGRLRDGNECVVSLSLFFLA